MGQWVGRQRPGCPFTEVLWDPRLGSSSEEPNTAKRLEEKQADSLWEQFVDAGEEKGRELKLKLVWADYDIDRTYLSSGEGKKFYNKEDPQQEVFISWSVGPVYPTTLYPKYSGCRVVFIHWGPPKTQPEQLSFSWSKSSEEPPKDLVLEEYRIFDLRFDAEVTILDASPTEQDAFAFEET